jgi:hypothetical protein
VPTTGSTVGGGDYRIGRLLQATTDRLGGLSCRIGPLLYGLLYGLGRVLDRAHYRLGSLLGRRNLIFYRRGLLFYRSRIIGDRLGRLLLRRSRKLECWRLLYRGGLLLNGGRQIVHRLGRLGLGFSAEQKGDTKNGDQCADKGNNKAALRL